MDPVVKQMRENYHLFERGGMSLEEMKRRNTRLLEIGKEFRLSTPPDASSKQLGLTEGI